MMGSGHDGKLCITQFLGDRPQCVYHYQSSASVREAGVPQTQIKVSF